MVNENGCIMKRIDAIKTLNSEDMMWLLEDIQCNPDKYPKTKKDWRDWINRLSGKDIYNF